MRETTLQKKSKAFAVRIIKMYQYLCDERHEFVLSKQVLRSGTSIGANVREAKRAQSTTDFYTKLFIALKEAEETGYCWNFCPKPNISAKICLKAYMPIAKK